VIVEWKGGKVVDESSKHNALPGSFEP
jgi:hypothetical protein